MSTCSGARAVAAPLTRVALAAVLVLFASSAAAQATGPVLTLPEALTRAAGGDPSRSVQDARIAAANAAVSQAGLRSNPRLGLEVENFTGTGAYALLDRTEATLSYEQTLERGGKRTARTGLARAQLEVARHRGAVRGLDFLRDVQVAYAEALAAEATLLVADARFVTAAESQRAINRRVRSARDPLFAGSRAAAVAAQAEIDRDAARAAAEAAKARLAAYIGTGPQISLDLKTFFEPGSTPVLPTVEAADLELLAAERDVAAAAVRIEQAKAVSDPTVRAGVRYLGQDSDVALVVGGTVPLRRYDTNRAGVARAQAERTAAESEIGLARSQRDREIARLLIRIAAAARDSERIRAEVIPALLRTVDQVSAGFARGGFQYLDVTEAERALTDARTRRVEIMRQHHLDQAALDRLTGRHGGLVQSTLMTESVR